MPTLESERKLSFRSSNSSPKSKVRSPTRSPTRSRPSFDFSVFKASARPKSTPAYPWTPRSTTTARPQTSIAVSEDIDDETFEYPGCERVVQVYREPVRKHNLTSSLPTKKNAIRVPSAAAAAADGVPSCFQVGPGYVMYRSKSRISININSNEFWGKDEVKENTPMSAKKVEEDYRDVLIAKLQDQINDLKLFLEEEKLNHKDTIQRCAEELKHRLLQMSVEHDEEMRRSAQEHARELAEMSLQFEAEMQKYRTEAEELENKLRQDIDFLQASFESYKSALSVEVQDRLKEREAQLRQEFDLELKKAANEMQLAFNREKIAERNKWEQEHQREMDRLRRDHRKEMDTLARQFTEAQSLVSQLDDIKERLEKQTAAFERLEEAHKFLMEEKERTVAQLKLVEEELEKTLKNLKRLEDSFDDRVKRVDEQYQVQIEGLKRQAVDMRRAYLAKCSELVEEKTKNDLEMMDRLETAKDAIRTVVNARNRTALSIAALDDEEANRERRAFVRPLSAPVTADETGNARDCAGNTAKSK